MDYPLARSAIKFPVNPLRQNRNPAPTDLFMHCRVFEAHQMEHRHDTRKHRRNRQARIPAAKRSGERARRGLRSGLDGAINYRAIYHGRQHRIVVELPSTVWVAVCDRRARWQNN